jgi:hypothetical protein
MHDVQTRSVRFAWVSVGLGIYAAATALAQDAVLAVALAAAPLAAAAVWWIIQAPSRWLKPFLFACILLPPVNLPIGSAGPHPAILCAAAGAFTGLLRLREWLSRWDTISLSLAAFFLVLLSSVPLAASYSGFEVMMGSLARVGLFGISVYLFLFVRNNADIHLDAIQSVRWLLWVATAAAAFACVDFYFQLPAPAGFGPQFVWLDTGVFRRAQGLFYEASTLGNFCAFFLVMIVVAVFKREEIRPASRLLMLMCAVVVAAALVVSYSRASLVNLAVAVSVLVVLHRERLPWMRLIASFAALCLAGAALIYTVFPAFAQMYWTRLTITFQFFYAMPDRVLSGRVQTWERLVAIVAADPLLVIRGIGYKTLPYTSHFGDSIIADNMYLSLLLEVGLLGLAAFAVLNWSILASSLRAARNSSPAASFLGTWFFCFWIGELVQMLSGDLLTYWRVLPVYFFVLALSQREME